METFTKVPEKMTPIPSYEIVTFRRIVSIKRPQSQKFAQFWLWQNSTRVVLSVKVVNLGFNMTGNISLLNYCLIDCDSKTCFVCCDKLISWYSSIKWHNFIWYKSYNLHLARFYCSEITPHYSTQFLSVHWDYLNSELNQLSKFSRRKWKVLTRCLFSA